MNKLIIIYYILYIMGIELDSTEEKIVSATFRIMLREGKDKATTKRISKEAGVNEVTIFRKFENKKNLIEVTKDYYLQRFIDNIEEIFDFDEDDELEDYIQSNFEGLLNLPEEDFSIIKVAMEEVSDIPDKKLVITLITDTILKKCEEFFTLQIQKGKIRDINPKAISVMFFSITFQSVVLWKVYNKTPDEETKDLSRSLLDIIYNGIKP
jgi:AcrR family transcriptional regulator